MLKACWCDEKKKSCDCSISPEDIKVMRQEIKDLRVDIEKLTGVIHDHIQKKENNNG